MIPYVLLLLQVIFYSEASSASPLGSATIVLDDMARPMEASLDKDAESYLSIVDLDHIPQSENLILTDKTGKALHYYSITKSCLIEKVSLGKKPSGSVITKDGSLIYTSIGEASSELLCIDAQSGVLIKRVATGHGLNSPVLSPDESKIYACSRFQNKILIIDAKKMKLLNEIPVLREPVSCDISPDGQFLLVANHLPANRADLEYVSAKVSLIDLTREKRIKDIDLPDGSESLRCVKFSKDGSYAYATHLIARYHIPTNQIERGWINTNALSIISMKTKGCYSTVLLDDVSKGFANPWDIDISEDGETMAVSSAGNSELSLIDLPALHKAIAQKAKSNTGTDRLEEYNDLSFLSQYRKRVQLKSNGLRSVLFVDDNIFSAGYFSESMDLIKSDGSHARFVELQHKKQTEERKGEMFFNDASFCFQNWQSCASCHSDDGRVDGMNWDLLNDGIGNPKNAKSLLYSHFTAPVMALGVRKDAETAVRAGLKYIQFAERPEEDAQAIDAYLKSLKHLESPFLQNGKLSKNAKKGAKIFEEKGCLSCHSGAYYTDFRSYDLGTGENIDAGKAFDTPTLLEVWRTAPYMHDGRAATIEEAIDWHYVNGKWKIEISEEEMEQLVEYVKSL